MGRRETILNEAGKLIIRRGYKKTTIEDVAQACGLERASVYYYFKNKEEILTEVVRREVDRQSVILFERQNREKTAAGKLRALFRGHLEAFESSELAAIDRDNRNNVFQILPQAFDLLRARRDTLVELLIEVISVGVDSDELEVAEPRELAEGIRTLILGHAFAFLLNDAPSDRALTATFDALVRGVERNPA